MNTNYQAISRINEYSWVKNILSRYTAVKEYNPLLKSALETAESSTQIILALSSPVINKIDDSLHIDEKATEILIKLESKAEDVKSKATSYYGQTKDAYENTKGKVEQTRILTSELSSTALSGIQEKFPKIPSPSETIHQVVDVSLAVASLATRPVNRFLDATEEYVDKKLPIEEKESKEAPSSEESNVDDYDLSSSVIFSEEKAIIPRVKDITRRLIRGIGYYLYTTA